MEYSCCHFLCLFQSLYALSLCNPRGKNCRTNVLNLSAVMNFPFQLFRRHLDKADINTLMKIKVFLFDCDGVLWKGAKPISGAVETVKYLKDKGKSVFYCVSGCVLLSHIDKQFCKKQKKYCGKIEELWNIVNS